MGAKTKIFLALALVGAACAAVIRTTNVIPSVEGGMRRLAYQAQAEPLNPYVMETISLYPVDGSYRQTPSELVKTTLGVTKDLYYLGDRVAKGDPERRSYCVGLIFEVYLTSCERYAAAHGGSGARFFLPGVDRQDFSGFRKEFYGVNGNEKTFVEALVRRGLGKEIQPVSAAQPGDFVQFWRNGGSGHAVVFLRLESDTKGNPARLHYWSIQKKTGISPSSERIGSDFLAIDLDQVYIVRPFAPQVMAPSEPARDEQAGTAENGS